MMPTNTEKPIRLCVVGGGAAGLMCACVAARAGADVTLFEKNRSERILDAERCYDNAYLGKKLLITGKGRCNVTNDCTAEEFMASITANAKFLYAAFHACPPERVMAFFEEAGVPLKVERGKRVFPVSDRSLDILRAFKKELRAAGVTVVNRKVSAIAQSESGFRLTAKDTLMGEEKVFDADRVVLCTGGLSYPQTGSDGDGYTFAEAFGHRVTPLGASLVPLECRRADLCSAMSGLSLKNVTLTVTDTAKNKPVYSELGEMLFTHFGLSGPLVLSASAHMRPFAPDRYRADIDLKPALDETKLDARLVGLFEKQPNRNLANVLCEMLPKSMAVPFCEYCGIPADTKPCTVTKAMRHTLAAAFKRFSLTVSAFRPIAEAIVTAGGVNVKEVNPSTMESKLVSGLYFAGELLDVDAYTGGFNLQIAFSTAYLAAIHAARAPDSHEAGSAHRITKRKEDDI